LSTEYIVLVSPDRVKDAIGILARTFQEAAFSEDEIRREAGLVVQEYACNDGMLPPHGGDWNDPSAEARERLLGVAFSETNRQPVVTDALATLTREQLAAVCSALYRPESTVISIVGGVNAFNILVETQRRFANLGKTEPAADSSAPGATGSASGERNSSTKPAVGAQAPVQSGPPATPPPERTNRLWYGNSHGDLARSVVTIGYRTDGLSLRDWLALEVLCTHAGRGRSSLFNRALLSARLAGCQPDAYLSRAGRAGLAVFQAGIPIQSIDKVESIIFKETDRLRREPVGPADVGRAKAVAEKRLVEATGSYELRARWIASAEAAWATLVRPSDYREGLLSISAEDLQYVAARYLSTANLFVYEREASSAPARTFDSDGFAATIKAWAPGLAQAVAYKERAATESKKAARTADDSLTTQSLQPMPVKDFSTLSGPRAFVREDHSQPQVAVGLLFQGGRIKEDETSSGITELMLRSMLQGTSRRTGAQVASDLEQLGAELEVVSEPDFFGVLLSVLSRNGEAALKTAREVLEEPVFRDEDIDRARSEQLSAVDAARDSSTVRARELLFRSLFAGHPYSLPPHGREDVIKKVTSEQLKSWYAATIKRQYPVVVVVGDTDGSALISAEVAERFRRNDTDKTLSAKIPREPSSQTEIVEQRQQLRTVVAFGVPGPRADNLSSSVLPVLRFGLDLSRSGQQNGLLYDVLLTGGAIYSVTTVPASSESVVRTTLKEELERLGTTGLTAAEVDSIRAKAVVAYNSEMQSQRTLLFEYVRAVFGGRQASVVDELASSVSTVTSDDVKKFAGAYFKPSAFRAGVVRSVQVGR
jgi:zinc protease